MTPEVSKFISGSLEDTNKNIEVTDGHHVTAKQKGHVQMKVCNGHVYPLIATLHNVILAPYLCNRFFSIIKSMNSGHSFLSQKGFCTVHFG